MGLAHYEIHRAINSVLKLPEPTDLLDLDLEMNRAFSTGRSIISICTTLLILCLILSEIAMPAVAPQPVITEVAKRYGIEPTMSAVMQNPQAYDLYKSWAGSQPDLSGGLFTDALTGERFRS